MPQQQRRPVLFEASMQCAAAAGQETAECPNDPAAAGAFGPCAPKAAVAHEVEERPSPRAAAAAAAFGHQAATGSVPQAAASAVAAPGIHCTAAERREDREDGAPHHEKGQACVVYVYFSVCVHAWCANVST